MKRIGACVKVSQVAIIWNIQLRYLNSDRCSFDSTISAIAFLEKVVGFHTQRQSNTTSVASVNEASRITVAMTPGEYVNRANLHKANLRKTYFKTLNTYSSAPTPSNRRTRVRV